MRAIQPEQGHLEYLEDGVNGWGVDFNDPVGAKAALNRIASGGLDEAALLRRLPGLPAIR